MTRITKLEMQGFKSFAKKTQLLFPSNFVSICGPNGSGKSNLMDAVCFVLGRSSAKTLRADRMLQMIYHGGEKKGKADFAKVSLYFDNSEKEFPLEENPVIISRKVNKKGISIYKLNGITVSREKILEVMRKVHVLPDGHNIILQGDVTEIIEMSDFERREIIDEISGIEEFEQKQEKAQRELATVEERLKETGIIINEREQRLRELEAEKEAAEKHDRFSKELDKYRAALATKRMNDAGEAMSLLNRKIKEKEEGFAKFNEDQEKSDNELEEKEKKLEKILSRLFDRTKDFELIKEEEKIKAEIQAKKGRIESNLGEIERLNNLISKLEEMRDRQESSRSVKEVLKLGKDGIYGTVNSLLKVSEQYQTAIEVCAGSHLHDIVVSDKDTAIDCVNYLKKNKIGRAVFLPLDKIQERDSSELKKFIGKPGVIGIALDLIEFDKRYWHAFSFVFGGTLVVDKIETARDLGIGKARFVTLGGDLAERSGVIIGGFYRRDSKAFFEEKEIKKYLDLRKTLEKEIEILGKDINNLDRDLDKLKSKTERGSEEVKKAQEEKKGLEEKLEDLKNKRKTISGRKTAVQDEVQRLKVNRARLEAEFENIKAEFENYGGRMEKSDLSPEVLQAKMKETVIAIQKLGLINQKAVEEYNQVKSACHGLKERVGKLSDERAKVLEMIAEVEGRKRGTFLKTLEAVSEQFKKVFHDLTGGEGSLRLEGEILEESGLVIEASPPGKNVLDIDSMSGGEKTLAALAFLFAIQQFSPAPFYILDEIDAALDKPNTKKIAELILKYSDTAQFIVITHNDTTIQRAGCIYGCSMEDGVSKLVGIKMP